MRLELKPKGYILEQDTYILISIAEQSEENPKRIYKDRSSLRQEIFDVLNKAEVPLYSEKILDRVSHENRERRPLIRMLRRLCDDRLVKEESIEGLKKYSLVKFEFNHGKDVV